MNTNLPRLAASLLLVLLASAPTHAQTVVSSVNKFGWSENCGHLNFRDAGNPPTAQGIRVYGSYLTGYIWGENIGWVHAGNGGPYANTNNTDYGVNYNAGTGALTGLAWGENVGWINFSGGALAVPANAARIDATRIRGYAWGENIGWINLDDANVFVGFKCPADFNESGAVSVQDIFDFLAAYFAGLPEADINGSGTISVQDIFDFLTAYFSGSGIGC